MDSQWGRGLRRWLLAARGGDGGRMLFARRAIALAGAMLAAALAPASAHAVDPLPIDPAIDRAVVQLDGVQLADGGFGARLALRDTASVGEALRAARPNRPAIGWIDTFLAGRGLEDVDSLARVALGSPAAVQASALLAEQSADGGFASRATTSPIRLTRPSASAR